MPRRAHVGMWVATTVTQQINVTSENTKDVCVCVRACVHACVRACVRVYAMFSQVPKRPVEGTRPPGTGVTGQVVL